MGISELKKFIKIIAFAKGIKSFKHDFNSILNDGGFEYPLMVLLPATKETNENTETDAYIYSFKGGLFDLNKNNKSDNCTEDERDVIWQTLDSQFEEIYDCFREKLTTIEFNKLNSDDKAFYELHKKEIVQMPNYKIYYDYGLGIDDCIYIRFEFQLKVYAC